MIYKTPIMSIICFGDDDVNTRLKGILFLILSAFFFAAMNMFVKLSGDLPTFQKVFFRNAFAAVIALIILIKNKAPFRPKSKKTLPFLILRTVCGLLGVICNYYALDQLVLSDASILNKMSPFFAIIFSFFVMKERPKLYQWLTVTGAFFGALFVIKPSFSNSTFIPSVIGFLGGMFAGAAYAFVRKLGTMGENNAFIVFFFSACSTLAVTPVMIIGYAPMTWLQLVYLLSAGLSAALAQFSVTAAYTCAPAKEISVYDFSQILFAAAFGFFVFAQLPDVYSLIGYMIIISMAVLNYMFSRPTV